MDKNKECPYSLEQIAKRLGWKWGVDPLPDKNGIIQEHPHWRNENREWVWSYEMLPNFYSPEHNWWVRDAVEKLVIERGCRIETTAYHQPTNGCNYFNLSIERGVHTLTIVFECVKKLEDKGRAYIEALGELKRLEKKNENG